MVVELFDNMSHNEGNFTALLMIFTKYKMAKGSFSNSTLSTDCLCQIIWGANGFQGFFGIIC